MHCNIMRWKPVFRSLSIIAAFCCGGWVMSAGAATEAAPFAAYQVRLEVMRNGVLLGSPEATLATGLPSPVEVLASRPGALRVMQRVTAFPGAAGDKALLELEFLGQGRGEVPNRIVAPTIGVSLGRAQIYEMSTEQGFLRIRATVEGLDHAPVVATDTLETFAYPEI